MNRLTETLSQTDVLTYLYIYTFTHSQNTLTLKQSQTCPPVHSHSHTHTLTCAYWHSLLHTNMLKHSLNHMTMPIDSFTQGHKCLYSKVPTHTFHLYMHIFTQNLCSHRYSHTNMFTSAMKLRYSLKEENTLTSTSTHVYVSHKYTHLLTRSQRWTWYTFLFIQTC